MKLVLKIYLLIILSVVISSCCNNPEKNREKSLQITLDSLQKIYAPDKRVKLWISSINNNKFSLWLENKKAYAEINNILRTRFPHIQANIKLLPKNNSNALVSGLINNSVANLRTKPKHSSELATQALLGTPVRVFTKQGDWYLIQTPNRYIAWVDSAALVTVNQKELETYKQKRKIVFTPVSGFSYAEPDINSQTISDLVMGAILPVLDEKKEFYKVQYPDHRIAWVKKGEVEDFNTLVHKKTDRQQLVKTAKRFLGFPYMWGGTSSKAVDCSGFTSTIYFMNGIVLQRDASQQVKYGKEITTIYNSENLIPGDLLFFGRPASGSLAERVTHVAMYIGNGEFIHASGKVRINSMDSTQANFIKSYVPRFVRAKRIIGHVDGKGIEYVGENSFYLATLIN